jgi:hypothetical protein
VGERNILLGLCKSPRRRIAQAASRVSPGTARCATPEFQGLCQHPARPLQYLQHVRGHFSLTGMV